MLPQYSIHALRNKHKRIKQFGWSQHVSCSRSAFDRETTIEIEDSESEPASERRSTKLGPRWELRDKQQDQNPIPYKSLSASRSGHDDYYHDSTLQANEAVGGANVGAMRKGGVVKWFDEEIQLLMDLYWQEKSWEDIFEVGSR